WDTAGLHLALFQMRGHHSHDLERSARLQQVGVDVSALRLALPRVQGGGQCLKAIERRRHVDRNDRDAMRDPIFTLVRVEHSCEGLQDRKSTRLNSSHVKTSYAVFCLKK